MHSHRWCLEELGRRVQGQVFQRQLSRLVGCRRQHLLRFHHADPASARPGAVDYELEEEDSGLFHVCGWLSVSKDSVFSDRRPHSCAYLCANYSHSVTLVSILRLKSMIQFGSTTNVTRKSRFTSTKTVFKLEYILTQCFTTEDYVEVGYWSMIEVSIGIVCACMPACRALISITHQMISGSRKSRSGTGSNSKTPRSDGDIEHNRTIGSAGVRNKRVLKRYSKFGNSTEITLDTSMNPANWSDVELVAMEKAPSPQTDADLLTPAAASSPHSSKRWSAISGNIRDSFGFFQSKAGGSSRSGMNQG